MEHQDNKQKAIIGNIIQLDMYCESSGIWVHFNFDTKARRLLRRTWTEPGHVLEQDHLASSLYCLPFCPTSSFLLGYFLSGFIILCSHSLTAENFILLSVL